jgi:hypothetical protein
MSDEKYVVRLEAIKAVIVALEKRYGVGENVGVYSDSLLIPLILEAFIRWQSENPPKASMKQLQEMYDKVDQGNGGTYIPSYLEEWVRRMYLAPEPEEPEALKDLLVSPFGDYGSKLQLDICKADCARQNAKLIEAYERGKAGK